MTLSPDLAAEFARMLAEDPAGDHVEERSPETSRVEAANSRLIATALRTTARETDALQSGLARLRALLDLQERQLEDLESRGRRVAPGDVAARRLLALRRA